MGIKDPMLIDFTGFRVGTYKGYEKSSRKGYVKPKFIPLGSVNIASPVEFETPVPKEAIIHIEPSQLESDKSGVEDEYVIITEGADGTAEMLEQVDKLQKKKISQLKNEMRNSDIRSQRDKLKRIEAEEGQEELESSSSDGNQGQRNMNYEEW